MRVFTATLIFALLLSACGAGLHRIVAINGVQVGTVDPNDHSVTTPNPSRQDHCVLARGIKDGKSLLEYNVSDDVKEATLSIGTSDGSYIGLGYNYGVGDPRDQTIGLTVSRNSITLNDGITITGEGNFGTVIVKLEVTLTDGSTPTACQLSVTPAQ